MKAIITHDSDILLEYNLSTDAFEVSEDAGRSYPYELYEDIVINDEEFYLIHLEDKDMIPTSKFDVWLPLDAAISHLENYKSKTEEGKRSIVEYVEVLKSESLQGL